MSKNERLIALLLCVSPLGFLGVHKAYEGNCNYVIYVILLFLSFLGIPFIILCICIIVDTLVRIDRLQRSIKTKES